MIRRVLTGAAAFVAFSAVVVSLNAAAAQQGADAFSQKIARILKQGETTDPAGARRTTVSQDEMNSWFTHRAQPLLPRGVTQPQVTIVGQGKVAGQAIVDLEAVGRRRSSGGMIDPWSLLGGRVPVTVSGVLHTRDGMGRFEVQEAAISGISVPPAILQDLVSYYSRSPERPEGVRIDNTFALPANIREIQIGPGQAIVVQ
jgi:hypothetical protein